MENLRINATSKSFEIVCERGRIQIRGCSIINDPRTFFHPLQTWVGEYLKDPPDETEITIKIDYIDSASSKFIFDILKNLEKIFLLKKTVSLKWYYDIHDPEILEIGEILGGRIKIPFKFIQY